MPPGATLPPATFYQFKNTLLPLVTVLLYFWMRIRPDRTRRILFAIFLASTVLAAVGAGRRRALAFFAAAFVIISLARYMAPFRSSRKQILVGAVVALLLLSTLTLMMGARGSGKVVDSPLVWAPLQLLDRVFIAPAHERLNVYEIFLKGKKPLWGEGTLRQLEVLLPGKSYFTLSNELHGLLYGSFTGNVGLDIWGSLWYDFHWLGLVFLFGFGFLCHGFYVYLLRGPKRLTRVVTLGYAGLLLGLISDFAALFNFGFATCMIFLFLTACVRVVEKGVIHTLGAVEAGAPA